MTKAFSGIIAAALMIAAAPSGYATNYTFNTTVALNPALINQHAGYQNYSQSIAGAPSFNVQAGDTIAGTITFSNFDVQIQSAATSFTEYLEFLFGLQPPATNQNAHFTGSWIGLNLAGGTAAPTMFSGSNGSSVALGSGPDLLLHNFTVSGINYSMTFTLVQDSLSNPTTAAIGFNGVFLEGDSLSFVSQTPEPASLAFMAAGLGVIAAFRRRRI